MLNGGCSKMTFDHQIGFGKSLFHIAYRVNQVLAEVFVDIVIGFVSRGYLGSFFL